MNSSWPSVLVEWAHHPNDVALAGEAERALANLDGAAIRVKMAEVDERRARGNIHV